MNVQSWEVDDRPDRDQYLAVECTACGLIHFVIPQTGKIMGDEGDGLVRG
jgi:hypothetical protein